MDRSDEEFLIKFLRARFFKLEPTYMLVRLHISCVLISNEKIIQQIIRPTISTQIQIRNYYNFRKSYPELHKNLNPLRLFRLGADDVVTVSPYKDQHQRRMMFFKIGNWQPNRISINEFVSATLLLLELGSLEPVSQVMGGVGIFDFAGYSLNHLWYCSPTLVQQVIALIVTSVPQRTNEIHILNNGWAFDLMFRMFKPFLDERMLRKIHIHGSDLESFHRHIDPAHLPVVYGGVMPEIEYREWLKSISTDLEIQRRLEKLGYVFDFTVMENYAIV